MPVWKSLISGIIFRKWVLHLNISNADGEFATQLLNVGNGLLNRDSHNQIHLPFQTIQTEDELITSFSRCSYPTLIKKMTLWSGTFSTYKYLCKRNECKTSEYITWKGKVNKSIDVSVVPWRDILEYLQKCEGSTHFCDTLYIYIYIYNKIFRGYIYAYMIICPHLPFRFLLECDVIMFIRKKGFIQILFKLNLNSMHEITLNRLTDH